jgi:hypothetical protein
MPKLTVTITNYDELSDLFDYQTSVEPELYSSTITGTELSDLIDIRTNLNTSRELTNIEYCLARIHEDHWEEEPGDLINKTGSIDIYLSTLGAVIQLPFLKQFNPTAVSAIGAFLGIGFPL